MTAPWIVGTITTAKGLAYLREAESAADLVEVRLDALIAAGVPLREIRAALSEGVRPALLTPRSSEEGGRYDWAEGERRKRIDELFPAIDALDLELAALPELVGEWERAKAEGKRRILSVHWLGGNPGEERIRESCAKLEEQKPDWAKIALRFRELDDLRLLVGILLEHRVQAWALMGLGPWAGLSRIVLAALGSRLAYGYLDEAGAPGQPSVEELAGVLRSVGLGAPSGRRMMRAPGR